MPGNNPTQQAQQNQQSNQQQAEQYWQGLVNQMTGNLKSYLGSHPSPASQWAAINNPAKQTGRFGGGEAQGRPTIGGGEAQARPTVGSSRVPGAQPWDPAPTPLERALIGTQPRGGKK